MPSRNHGFTSMGGSPLHVQYITSDRDGSTCQLQHTGYRLFYLVCVDHLCILNTYTGFYTGFFPGRGGCTCSCSYSIGVCKHALSRGGGGIYSIVDYVDKDFESYVQGRGKLTR